MIQANVKEILTITQSNPKLAKAMDAKYISVQIINDNMREDSKSQASFGWQLINDNKTAILASGKIIMSATDYAAWDNTNSYAYTYVSKKIGVNLA